MLWPWRNYLEVDRRMVRALERAVVTVDESDPSLLVRAFAGLGVERYYLPDPRPADEASARAMTLAGDLGDIPISSLALDLRCVAIWRPDRMAEMVAVADRLVATANAAGLDDRTVFVGAFLRLVAHLALGQVGAATEDEALWLALADRLRTPTWSWCSTPTWRCGRRSTATSTAPSTGSAHGIELHRRTQVWPADDARLGLIVPLAVDGGAEQLADGLLAARGRGRSRRAGRADVCDDRARRSRRRRAAARRALQEPRPTPRAPASTGRGWR